MDRRKKSIAFLDTHSVIWLRAGLTKKFSLEARKIINASDLYISPLVKLELQYLYEIKKLKEKPEVILLSLEEDINFSLAESDYEKVVIIAATLVWTRDVFDRLLVAEAKLHDAYFISADRTIRNHYKKTVI